MRYGVIHENFIYELEYGKIRKRDFRTQDHYFAKQYQLTFNTVHIKYDNTKTYNSSNQIIISKYIPNYLKPGNKLDRFEISDKIPKDLKCIIKYFHIFKTKFQKQFYTNVLLVTIDDKVFGMGENYCGVLGLGHDLCVEEPEIIPELCDKKFIEFHHGIYFVLGLTSDNNLYSWGQNYHGQLGIGLFYVLKFSNLI